MPISRKSLITLTKQLVFGYAVELEEDEEEFGAEVEEWMVSLLCDTKENLNKVWIIGFIYLRKVVDTCTVLFTSLSKTQLFLAE